MPELSWLSILPPALAIFLAIVTRQVFLSLFMGIWLGWTILNGWNPLSGLAASIEGCIGVFADGGNTKVILFSAMVGGVIALTQASGGVAGFVSWVSSRRFVQSRRHAFLLSWFLGVVIFVESSMTALVNGSVCRPIFDKFQISREKLAYLCDATSAPICILIPLNAWGAYIVRLLEKEGYQEPVATLAATMPYNLYAIFALLLSFYIAWTARDFGPMKRAELRAAETGKVVADDASPMLGDELTGLAIEGQGPVSALPFLLPIAAMVAMMPVGLYITGQGDLMNGSGSTSVFWSVCLALFVGAVCLYKRARSVRVVSNTIFAGLGNLLPLAVLMVLAFALGSMTKELKTGIYVATLVGDHITPAFVPVSLFLISCVIAFSTGTSWGTFAIMIPLAVPMVTLLPGQDALLLAAVLGGGIFGDHCSPISDTTIISSMAAGSDHIDHVRTQLPYAAVAAGGASLVYIAMGLSIL